MENQSPDAYFAIFYLISEDIVLIIARGQRKNIDLNALLSNYGGGGHLSAASARVSSRGGLKFVEEFLSHLEQRIKPAAMAKDIMTKNVFTIHETTSLKDASMFLERVDLTAVPVVGKQGGVTGLISLRDIMKGRKHGKMHAPVTAYMSKPVISVGSEATMREIEQIFFKNKISHLPVLDEGKLKGIVSRWDYLQFTSRAYSL
jgi:tRNA nucleotidyltransferase (CCA-adding enzyme)